MMSEPRMIPPAMATSAPMPDTSPERTPVVIIGQRVVDRLPDVLQRVLVDAERVGLLGGLVEGIVGRVADLVRLVGHALSGRDHDADHQREQAEHDEAGGERRLEPVPHRARRPAA